ncbi:hypothetical protein ACFL1S_06850, partial [Pseudomonadota bacterium]
MCLLNRSQAQIHELSLPVQGKGLSRVDVPDDLGLVCLADAAKVPDRLVPVPYLTDHGLIAIHD